MTLQAIPQLERRVEDSEDRLRNVELLLDRTVATLTQIGDVVGRAPNSATGDDGAGMAASVAHLVVISEAGELRRGKRISIWVLVGKISAGLVPALALAFTVWRYLRGN